MKQRPRASTTTGYCHPALPKMSSMIRLDAKKHRKEVMLTRSLLSTKCLDALKKPFKLDDGLFPAAVVQESLGWRKVLLHNISSSVFTEVLWDNIEASMKSVKKSSNGDKCQAQFFDQASFSRFWKSCFKKFGTPYLRHQEKVGADVSCIFATTYGMIKSDFKEDAIFDQEYKLLFEKKGWTPCFTDNSVSLGKLKCTYRQLQFQLAFVLQTFHEKYNAGKKGIFYLIAVPEDGNPLVEVMPGVKFPRKKGVVPATCLIQRNARLPVVQYLRNRHKLQKVVLAFRPMQVINNRLQWKIRPLSCQESSDSDNEIGELVLPPGYSRFVGNMSQDFLDGGYLAVGPMHTMFKLYEDEWCHFKVLRFIPVEERGENVFTYEVRIIGNGNGQLPVLFDINRYNPDCTADAPMATWFVIHQAN